MGKIVSTNTIELKVEMLRHGDDAKALSKALGVTEATMSHKINGETEWKVDQIHKVIKRYELPAERTMEIFFAESMS